MRSPATAIKSEIHELIDLQIQVFGQPATLTPFELEDFRRRAERIKSLGRELDHVRIAAIRRNVGAERVRRTIEPSVQTNFP